MDHEERFFVAAIAEFVPHGGEFDLHGALQIGVKDCGEGAFVFAEFADDLAGENYRQVADVEFLEFVANDFLNALFVNGIEEAPEE